MTYDASGRKIRKQVLNNANAVTYQQDYFDDRLVLSQLKLIYQHKKRQKQSHAKWLCNEVTATNWIAASENLTTPAVEAIYHPEGRAIWTGTSWRYEFNITDHLGNVRAVISDLNNDKKLDINTSTTTNEIINVTSYYPFGMVMAGTYANNTTTPDTRYQYNGKEMNSDLGLNLLDYGARWYDPSIGRFTGVDLLSESLENYSGFSYAANNPILLVDFYGLSPLYNWDEHSKGNKGLYNNGGNAVSFEEAINIATKGMKNSAYITQKSNPMSKTGCDKAICAAMDYANDNTAVSFVMADNLNGVSNELERISSTKGKFDNLVFASHGSREHFYVGLQTISDPDLDNEWNRVKNVLKSNSNVTILACNVGFLANGRNPLLEALALKLESRIFGNQSLSYPGSPHSLQYTTNKAIKKEYPKFTYEKINNRWSVFEYSKGQVKISVVRNFFLSKDLTPHYEKL